MSLRAAINAKCKDCIHDPLAPGTWRAQVEACTCRDCPLWPYRPLTVSTAKANGASVGDSADSGQKMELEA